MIHTIRTVTVDSKKSVIDSPIVLYRGDREVEIEFSLVGSKFTFSEGGNVIKSLNAAYGQLIIHSPNPNIDIVFSEITECNDGKVVFLITKEMIDELVEVGTYDFQIRLYDTTQVSRATIPPVSQGLDIRHPIGSEEETNVVDIAIAEYSVVRDDPFEEVMTFLPNGDYNKTEWASNALITAARMNKIEDGLYTVNRNMEVSDTSLFNRIEKVNSNLSSRLDTLDDQIFQEVTGAVDADMEALESRVINELNVQLNSKVNENYIFGINEVTDSIGVFNVANFAQQGSSSAPIGFVMHHYTDATMFQVDSVGENNEILVLKNAKNATRRPDKPNDFVGTGKFLVLKNHNNDLGSQVSLFAIDKNCVFTWYDFTPTAVFKHVKNDDGSSAFDVVCQNKHATMLRLLNGSSVVLDVLNDSSLTRMHIRSGTSQTNGLMLEARQGNLDLVASNGKVTLNGHPRKVVQTTFYGSAASERPTATATIGEMFYDTNLKKPIWFDGSVWRDATGTQV